MTDTKVRPLVYGALTPISRIAEVYGTTKDYMRRILCRSEFYRYSVSDTRPILFMWNPPFEMGLDMFLAKKGKFRCIGSKVLSKSLLAKANLYSISTTTGTPTLES